MTIQSVVYIYLSLGFIFACLYTIIDRDSDVYDAASIFLAIFWFYPILLVIFLFLEFINLLKKIGG